MKKIYVIQLNLLNTSLPKMYNMIFITTFLLYFCELKYRISLKKTEIMMPLNDFIIRFSSLHFLH